MLIKDLKESGQEIDNKMLFRKLCEVEKLLKNLSEEKKDSRFENINENSREIWTIHDIAKYCGFSYEHVFRSIITSKRFPAPVDIPSRTGGNAKKIYIAGEVVSYFLNNKRMKKRQGIYAYF